MTKVEMSPSFEIIRRKGFFTDLPSEGRNEIMGQLYRQIRIDSDGEDICLLAVPELENYSYKDHEIYKEGICSVISNTDKKYYEALISLARSTTFHYHKNLTELVRVRETDDSVLFIGYSRNSDNVKKGTINELSSTPLKDGMIIAIPPLVAHGFYVPKGDNLIIELVTDDSEYEDTDILFKEDEPFYDVAERWLSK